MTNHALDVAGIVLFLCGVISAWLVRRPTPHMWRHFPLEAAGRMLIFSHVSVAGSLAMAIGAVLQGLSYATTPLWVKALFGLAAVTSVWYAGITLFKRVPYWKASFAYWSVVTGHGLQLLHEHESHCGGVFLMDTRGNVICPKDSALLLVNPQYIHKHAPDLISEKRLADIEWPPFRDPRTQGGPGTYQGWGSGGSADGAPGSGGPGGPAI